MMRYILLASLAVSDLLCLILVNSFRIASIAQERWLYGETMCYLNPCFVRYFYLNTVLHLLAVSYDRYCAIVKSPLTYDGTITKSKVIFIALIWIIPIPLSIGPFLGWGKYVYNPEVFFCEQGWAVQSGSSRGNMIVFPIASFLVPFMIIAFLNWSVYKAARSQINAIQVQLGSFQGSCDFQQQEISRRSREQKAAVDVSIIIAAFLLCYLPSWVMGVCRQFVNLFKVPSVIILLCTGISFLSSLCNPIIYSIRKEEFQAAVKTLFRRTRLIGNNYINALDNVIENLTTEAFTSIPIEEHAVQHQNEAPIQAWQK